VTTTATGLVHGLDEAEYHAHQALSSTQMKWLLRSPAHYQWNRAHRIEKAEFDLGHAVHAELLGEGMDIRVVPGPWTTRAAKLAVDEAREDGAVPLKPEQWEQVAHIVAAVREHPIAAGLLRDGDPEVSAFWDDDATGVTCRARFDWITTRADGRPLLVDLKTTAKPATSFARAVLDYGYDTQAAHYLDGYMAATGANPLDVAFLHIVVEVDQPHGVIVGQLDDDALYVGRLKAARAREIYRDCTDAGAWPAYPADIHPLTLPAWAVRDAEEKYL
jgi:hypothetical protein